MAYAYSPQRETYQVNKRLNQLNFQTSPELTGLTRTHEEISTSSGISGKAPGMVQMSGCRVFLFGWVGGIGVGMDFRDGFKVLVSRLGLLSLV